MGRKKNLGDAPEPEPEERRDDKKSKKKKKEESPKYRDSDSDSEEPPTHDIDPDIQQLAYTFKIDTALTQKLNDIMINQRQRTWEQDIERLYEILKDAHTPAAMLNLKVKDMQKGTFVGKAKCGPKVKEIARKHRLDKGAATKLEEAMSMREAMGKDVDKDLLMLDEHLAASNKPSALISMKLESLRKGFNVGHCVYSRETGPGQTGPGVDGVIDKKIGGKSLGYTDADLSRRFNEQGGGGGGKLMDEATVRKMMQREKERHLSGKSGGDKDRKKSRSRSRSRSRGKGKKKDRRRSRSRSSSSRSRSRRRSRSRGGGKKSRGRSRSGRGKDKDRSRSRSRSGKGKKKDRKKSHSRSRSRSNKKAKEKDKEKDKAKEKDKEKDKKGGKDNGKTKNKKKKSESSSPRRQRVASSESR
eukprot:TRINITY_DN5364_c2_g3_i1.p1 TRINITY_DN5364_c2_g3~~TRINITY_DN5364_c2_g3_i1.p1  ORF type:complete len:415 (-),score=83.75 TRINITY_DN5364_c2_g3_i1:308-1552(-)